MSQDNTDRRCYGIAELAELAGVTRRTVRYYVQRGLLPTPLGTGRGPHYTQAHLERLIRIRTLQETGVPLSKIAARLDGVQQTSASPPEVLPECHIWTRFALTDGVELHVRTGAASFQPSQLARLVEAARQILGLQTASHPSARSYTHERHTTQLPDDVEPRPDPPPERTH
jgi:DNA-binding transcriptional MerR regulator